MTQRSAKVRLLDEAAATVARLPDEQRDDLARVLLRLAGCEPLSHVPTAAEEADRDAPAARGGAGRPAPPYRSVSKKYVAIVPRPFTSTGARASTANRPPSAASVSAVRCTRPGSPVASIRLATFTVSPQTS